MARIEAALDDPEHYDLDGYDRVISGKLSKWLAVTDELIGSAREGRIHREGIRTAVVGRPNAGKSSILNRLTDSERAIVTDIPGTTRDTLEETVRIGDTQLVLIDTAGIRNQNDMPDDPVEKIGIGRSLKAIRESDLIFAVLDGTESLSDKDRSLVEEIASAAFGSREPADIPAVIILVNKCDRERAVDPEEAAGMYREILRERTASEVNLKALCCSAKTGEGISALKEAVQEMFCSGALSKEQIWVTNTRHTALIENAAASLRMVGQAVSEGVSEDLYVIDLMNAYTALGKIIGEAVEDDLVDEIFSSFCMGK